MGATVSCPPPFDRPEVKAHGKIARSVAEHGDPSVDEQDVSEVNSCNALLGCHSLH